MNDRLTTLTELLREFPGIGPRQARRFAYWLVRRDSSWVERLSRVMLEARSEVQYCELCKKMFPATHGMQLCSICSNAQREATTLLVVEKDVDLENIERTGSYKGRYFVLGGTTSALDKEPEKKIRIRALASLLSAKDTPIKEVILALSATTHGEDTTTFVSERLEQLLKGRDIKISILGRGLSTGTELEYVDRSTMQSALLGRK